jgi:hypothetical protein
MERPANAGRFCFWISGKDVLISVQDNAVSLSSFFEGAL